MFYMFFIEFYGCHYGRLLMTYSNRERAFGAHSHQRGAQRWLAAGILMVVFACYTCGATECAILSGCFWESAGHYCYRQLGS